MTGGAGPRALVLVDLQEGYFNDTSGLRPAREQVTSAAVRLLDAAVRAGALVVEVRTVHDPDPSTWALNMREDGQPFMVRDSPETEPLPELAEVREQAAAVGVPWHVLEKTRDSAFHGTPLRDLLAEHDVDEVVLAGVSTESCVGVTATDAYAHDLHVVLAHDAVASADVTRHVEVLRHLDALYRQPAVGSEDVVFRSA